MLERTLVVLKPDAVERGLCGKIIDIFEEAGLKIVDARMFRPDADFISRHYPSTPKWLESLGNKSINNYKLQGLDIKRQMGTDDPTAVGKQIKSWLVEYMSSGRVMAMTIQGNHAIANVRKLVGGTIPMEATPGTIRARFSIDSSELANAEARSIKNLVHASGNAEEARFELELWFGKGAADVEK